MQWLRRVHVPGGEVLEWLHVRIRQRGLLRRRGRYDGMPGGVCSRDVLDRWRERVLDVPVGHVRTVRRHLLVYLVQLCRSDGVRAGCRLQRQQRRLLIRSRIVGYGLQSWRILVQLQRIGDLYLRVRQDR